MKMKFYLFVVGAFIYFLPVIQLSSGRALGGTVVDGEESLVLRDRKVVFNNPIRDVLHLQIQWDYQTNLRIEVLSVIGKIVYHQEIKSISDTYETTIPVSSFEKGMYILKISDDKNQYLIKKLMKY